MGIEKFTLPLNYAPRTFVAEHIQKHGADICRPDETGFSIIDFLIYELLDINNTCIFIDSGDGNISGIIIFEILKFESIIINSICVPKKYSSNRNSETLLAHMKNLAKKLAFKSIILYPVKRAIPFYQRNGFTCDDDLCTFNVTYNTKEKATDVETTKKKSTPKKNSGGKPTTKKQRKYTR
jgi:N-acetylglutamate synthase-like GNAT family acetyltransferase